MLTNAEKLRIDEVRALYETPVAASVEAMRIVQDTRGFVVVVVRHRTLATAKVCWSIGHL